MKIRYSFLFSCKKFDPAVINRLIIHLLMNDMSKLAQEYDNLYQGERTGLLANGDNAFEFGTLLSNWTKELTVFTNGDSTLTSAQTATFKDHNIQVVESKIKNLEQERGVLTGIVLHHGEVFNLSAIYTRPPFRQHNIVPPYWGVNDTRRIHKH